MLIKANKSNVVTVDFSSLELVWDRDGEKQDKTHDVAY